MHHLKDSRDNEVKARKQEKPKDDHKKIMDDTKDALTFRVKQDFNFAINQVKKGGTSANVENFNTCRVFLAEENRDKVCALVYFKNEQEEYNFRQYLRMMHVILSVTNSIGIIKVKAFDRFVTQAHKHYLDSFKHFTHLKSSLHWSLGHVIEQLIKNQGWSLAEVSENSLENLIKLYRYLTQNNARQTSFADNTEDCLKIINIISSYRMRKHDKRPVKPEKALKDDPESNRFVFYLVYSVRSVTSSR